MATFQLGSEIGRRKTSWYVFKSHTESLLFPRGLHSLMHLPRRFLKYSTYSKDSDMSDVQTTQTIAGKKSLGVPTGMIVTGSFFHRVDVPRGPLLHQCVIDKVVALPVQISISQILRPLWPDGLRELAHKHAVVRLFKGVGVVHATLTLEIRAGLHSMGDCFRNNKVAVRYDRAGLFRQNGSSLELNLLFLLPCVVSLLCSLAENFRSLVVLRIYT
jgi:hypothetical protein